MPPLSPVMNKTKLASEVKALGEGKEFKAFSDEKLWTCGFYVGSTMARDFGTDLKATKQAKSAKGTLTPSVKFPGKRLVVEAKGNADALRKVVKACLKAANLKYQVVFKEEGQEEPEPSAQDLKEYFEDITATTAELAATSASSSADNQFVQAQADDSQVVQPQDDDSQGDTSSDDGQTGQASTASTSSTSSTSSTPVSSAQPTQAPPASRGRAAGRQPNANVVSDAAYMQNRLKGIGRSITAIKAKAGPRIKTFEDDFRDLSLKAISNNAQDKDACQKGLVKLQADVDNLTRQLEAERQAQTDGAKQIGRQANYLTRPSSNLSYAAVQKLQDLTTKDQTFADKNLKIVADAVDSYTKIAKSPNTTFTDLQRALDKIEILAAKYNEVCVKQYGDKLKDPNSLRSEKYKANEEVLQNVNEAKQQVAAFPANIASLIADMKKQLAAQGLGQADGINRVSVETFEALAGHRLVPAEYQQTVAAAAKLGRGELDKAFKKKLQALQNPSSAAHAQVLLEGLGSQAPGDRGPDQKGQSDSFWLNDENGKLAYVFKPMKGESVISGDWEQGGGVAREVLATKLNGILQTATGITGSAINTAPARLTDDSFSRGRLSNDTQRMGVLIEAVPNDGSAESLFKKCKNPQDREALCDARNEDDLLGSALMGMTTLNLDQHSGNFLLKKTGDGKGETRVVPIDWGQSLPSPEAFLHNCKAMRPTEAPAKGQLYTGDVLIPQLPLAQKKLPDKHRAAVKKIDPDDVVAKAKREYEQLCEQFPELAAKVHPGSFDLMRKSLKFQKAAVDELTLYEMYKVFGEGFEGIVNARPEDEDTAIANAVTDAKYLADQGKPDGMPGADAMIAAKGIDPLDLSLAQKAVILRNNWDKKAWENERARQLPASLSDIGTYVADSPEKAEILQSLAKGFQGKDVAYLQMLADYRRVGGDPMLKKLMKGNEATYAVEVKRTLQDKVDRGVGNFWTNAERVNSQYGGYERLFAVIGNSYKGKPLNDQLTAFTAAIKAKNS